MNALQDINNRVRRHLKSSGQTQTAFGRAVCKNPNLVPRLERGNVTMATVQAVEAYLAQHLPKPKRKAAK